VAPKGLNKTELKLINDVSTRWNSTYLMFERILAVKEELTAVLGVLGNPVDVLSTQEWQDLESICQVLKPFQ
jgi:hypothetical protein